MTGDSGKNGFSDEKVVTLIPRDVSRPFTEASVSRDGFEDLSATSPKVDEYGMTDQDWIDLLIDSPGG